MTTAQAERSFLTEPEAVNYLFRYGIPYPEHGCAGSAGEAARLAGQLGYPVVLKIVSPDVVHKSDVGGVKVGLGSARAVRAGYGRILKSVAQRVPGARIDGMLVSRQAPPGLEVIV
ncbi:MAG TPA: acetate--CoA ligase family protein, partial [Anaerolineaceae bacterium]